MVTFFRSNALFHTLYKINFASTTLYSKVKVRMSLCLISSHAMKMYEGMEVQVHAFLTSELGGGEKSGSCLSYFTKKEKNPSTHWIGGQVSPRANLDVVSKRNIPASAKFKPHSSSL
jgi:hypothetical protein